MIKYEILFKELGLRLVPFVVATCLSTIGVKARFLKKEYYPQRASAGDLFIWVEIVFSKYAS